MTNEQLKGARRAMNEHPEVTFRMVPEGVKVGTVTVTIPKGMNSEAVYNACLVAVRQND